MLIQEATSVGDVKWCSVGMWCIFYMTVVLDSYNIILCQRKLLYFFCDFGFNWFYSTLFYLFCVWFICL